jgi:hypothetical protein
VDNELAKMKAELGAGSPAGEIGTGTAAAPEASPAEGTTP